MKYNLSNLLFSKVFLKSTVFGVSYSTMFFQRTFFLKEITTKSSLYEEKC